MDRNEMKCKKRGRKWEVVGRNRRHWKENDKSRLAFFKDFILDKYFCSHSMQLTKACLIHL